MELYTLIPENDPRLREAVPVFDLNNLGEDAAKEVLSVVIARMERTRKAHKALGLAANQVGLDLRMFVMGTQFANFVCINPEIIEAGNVIKIDGEGCLSFRGLNLKVGRPDHIKVRYLDQDLKEVTCEFNGILARCFQHELDHLNGVTFKDRVSKLVLAMAMKKREVKKRFR